MFLKDDTEVFRGEWEATRAKPPERPSKPLESSFKVGQKLPLIWEYRVNGPRAGHDGSLICTYFYQKVVVIYGREINEPVIRLIKKVDEATAQHGSRLIRNYRDRLGSYVVLFCDSKERAKELTALAEKEKLEHTILSLVVKNDVARLGDAETTLLFVGPGAIVKASYAYRAGELKDDDIERIVRELPKILVNKE